MLGVIDQAFSSGSNALILVAFARSSAVEIFGQLALIFLALTALLGVTRGLVGAHLALLGGKLEQLEDEAPFALALSLLVGLVVTALALTGCSLWGLPTAAWALAASPMVLVTQDTLRIVAIATGRPNRAAVSDGLWFAGSIAAIGLTVVMPGISSTTITTVWVFTAFLAMVLLWMMLPVRPRFAGMAAWIRRDLTDRLAFGFEGVISSLNGIAITVIVTSTLGFVATAAVRGAATVLGPLTLLMGALPLVLVPELSRSTLALDGPQLWYRLKWVGLTIGLVALALGSIGLWLPHSVGQTLLGDTWPLAQRVLPLVGLEYAFLAWMHAATTGLRALGAGQRLLSIRLAFSGCAITSALLLSQTNDVVYISGGLAAVAAVFALVSIFTLLHTREPIRLTSKAPPDDQEIAIVSVPL